MALWLIATVEILRRLRASLMSEPSFSSARFTGGGNCVDERDRIVLNIFYINLSNVAYTFHTDW